MKTGKIIQVLGPVVDVEFEDEELPAIRDALKYKTEIKNVSWKLHSISVIIRYVVLCWHPVKDFTVIWK